jgi:Fe2+ or Zn2+ uptake regulation protein
MPPTPARKVSFSPPNAMIDVSQILLDKYPDISIVTIYDMVHQLEQLSTKSRFE